MPPRSKCPKVKNPCKICLGAVNQKNGLQCCGACESWVHYKCLNYTPGRIKDIKAGIIQVTCPCPDCKTSLPKEFRTDEPFSCTNLQCPANKPPKCGNMQCPINNPMGMAGIPGLAGLAGLGGLEKMMQTSCPLSQCGKQDCKQHSSPNIPGMLAKPQQACSPNAQPAFNPMPMMSTSDACLEFAKCASGCVPPSPGDVGQMIHGGGGGGMAANAGLPSMVAMEQMCNTVGLLSKQIKEIMAKMQQAQAGSGGCNQSGCPQSGPKNLCPKPCYCPGNPRQ